MPFVPYLQSASIAPDYAGVERRIAPLPDEFTHDASLLAIIRVLFMLIPRGAFHPRFPVRVGVHPFLLISDGQSAALPSPNYLHTDGEPWTAIVLLERENLESDSGRNVIAEWHCRGQRTHDVRPGEIIATVLLGTPLDALIVNDSRVAHAVTACLGRDGRPGWRTTLAVDFSALLPQRTE